MKRLREMKRAPDTVSALSKYVRAASFLCTHQLAIIT